MCIAVWKSGNHQSAYGCDNHHNFLHSPHPSSFFLLRSKTKHEALARKHLDEVCTILAEKDDSLAKAALKAKGPAPLQSDRRDSSSSSKKRKSSSSGGAVDGTSNGSAHKKKPRTSCSGSPANRESGNMSEKELEQMEKLENFIEDRGGDRSLVSNFRCRVFKKGGGENRYDANYYSSFTPGKGKRFRSMLDVGRFVGVVNDNENARSAAGATKLKRVRTGSGASSTTTKEVTAERKKLRRELDRLRKQYSRATKSLDDFMNTDEKETIESSVDDALLFEKEPGILPSNCSASLIPDIGGFPGLPDFCMADVLQAWDFLCTFSRALNLSAISLADFVHCLTYQPPKRPAESDTLKDPPVYLGEAHLGLLSLLLADPSSDEWWWSILETEQTENAVVEEAAKAAAKEEESDLPLIKVDFEALLAYPEDPLITTSWLTALQPFRKVKDTNKVAMRQTLNSAIALVSNKWVLAYLRKAIKLGKTSGSNFMKRAVLWLADRVTDAKPELSANPPSNAEVVKLRTKVVEKVSQQMEKLSSATLMVDADDLVSDAEDDSDDESDDEGDDEMEDRKASATVESDENRAASYIPLKPTPSLVDFLLPPGKPLPPSELLNPPCWPHMTGAASCRIVHRYKRLRNEVDDHLRLRHELDRLTVKERREREAISTGRVLTEFVSQNGLDDTEEAIRHLCEGRDYLKLTPLQRLALLRVLIEAAYDTGAVFQVMDSNHKQRTNAVKALDMEQRRVKKEAKEKIAADEAAAREDLAQELKNNFIEEKHEEIRKLNENSNALTAEELEELTEQDILDFDEEYAAEYESLPTPESFKKAEVLERVNKLQELAAFETESLTVVTIEELIERERKDIEKMEEEIKELGGTDILDEEGVEKRIVRRIDKLRRDIARAKEAVDDYPKMRESAVATLHEAISDGTLKSLRAALRVAKNAKLYGPDEESNGVYALDVVRDAHLELEKAKHLKRLADAQKDLISKLNKCFIRTEPLGSDRFRNRFWRFESGDRSHVWTEINLVSKDSKSDMKNEPGHVDVVCDDPSKMSIGPADIESDFTPSNKEIEKDFQLFSRREYHSSGAIASLPKRVWGCHVNEASIRALMKGLDNRGMRENLVKKILKETLEDKTAVTSAAATATTENGGAKEQNGVSEGMKPVAKKGEEDEPETVDKFEMTGDEAAFARCKQGASSSSSDLILPKTLGRLDSAIGQKVRVRTVVESTRDGEIARYEIATITAWKTRKEEVPVESGETEFEPQTKEVDTPLWRAWTENCNEIWLSEVDLVESIGRYAKWVRKDEDYFESDSEFLFYRNGLGKYCGKPSEAVHAMSPFRFGQYLVKCEAELYQGLKVLALDNDWGGKSGKRNAWVTSMKDYSFDFQTVKDGLATLENAIFELTGGFKGRSAEEESGPSGKELLDDPKAREDIELESIDASVTGLWNSSDARRVFLEILRQCETVGFLSLALELICRNTRAYIVKRGVKAGRGSASTGDSTVAGYEQYAPLPQRTTRRMNAWQAQQQATQDAFWNEPVGGSRRGRQGPVSYVEPDMAFLDDLE